MIRTPWWALLLIFAAGLATALLWPSGSDAATDELRAQVDSARARVAVAEAVKDSAIAVADSSQEAHAALAASTDSTIARLTRRIQATTASAARTADEIRARVDVETAGLVDELEAQHTEIVEAERARTEAWRVRALSAEAGWQDERLARVAAEDQITAMEAKDRAQASLTRALEASLRRANRDKKLLVLAGIAGVTWGLAK